MNDYNELIRALRNGHVIGFNDDGFPVMHFPSKLEKIAAGVMEQLVKERDAAIAIIEELADMDYCHNFQNGDFWVVDFIHKISKIQKKAKKWRGVTE